MTYMWQGKQYIVVAISGGNVTAEYVAYAFGKMTEVACVRPGLPGASPYSAQPRKSVRPRGAGRPTFHPVPAG
jgi:hypothetical protein